MQEKLLTSLLHMKKPIKLILSTIRLQKAACIENCDVTSCDKTYFVEPQNKHNYVLQQEIVKHLSSMY